ncbi:HNH endonuclease [Microcella sp.]|uniref:HNH endonuclease n=1 Tax=Microcella sp. TaxID=1913979 RepID=UPI00391CB227
MASPDRANASKRTWTNKSSARFREIRAALERAAGTNLRCMYCDDNEGTAIDHFDPRIRSPELTFEWNNYLLACSGCNSNAKRSQFPIDENGDSLLVNPMREEPSDHLTLNPANGQIVTHTEKGLETIRVFNLNRERLRAGRTDAWAGLEALVAAYGRQMDAGLTEDGVETLKRIKSHAFAEVLEEMRRYAAAPNALLSDSLRATLRRHPEI